MSVEFLSGQNTTAYRSATTSWSGNQCSSQTAATPGNNGKETSRQSHDNKELTNEDKKIVSELKQRDREVRSHEAAHVAAGGGTVRGGATYSFQSGPDGRRYAVGGEVSIDASAVKDNPQATIQKMQRVRAAALAPANPSGQDRAVAAAATAREASARSQLNTEKKEQASEESSNADKDSRGGKELYGDKGMKAPERAVATLDITV